MTDRKLRVFLCHASQDKTIVRELYQRLNAEGWIDPWLDEEKLLPGQNWDMEIEKAVEASDIVIACFSKKSVGKDGYIQRELRFVLDIALEKPEGAIFIVPVRLDECELPRRIRVWQFTNYFPVHTRDRSWGRLRSSLKARAKSIGVDFGENKKSEKIISKPSIKKTDVKKTRKKITKPMRNVRTNLKFGNIGLFYVPAGNSVEFIVKSNDSVYSKKTEIKTLEIRYDYWISFKVISVAKFKIFMRSTKYKQDISELYKYSKKRFYISLNDALAYINWMNIRYKEQLPANYVFSLPKKAELIRAVVVVNLKNSDSEFIKEDIDDINDTILKFRGTFNVGEFHIAVTPSSSL